MKKSEKITVAIVEVLFAGLIFSRFGFAGTTATFTAHCYMPAIVSSATIEQVAVQDKNIAAEEHQLNDSRASEKNPNIVQKTEEIISQETKEPQVITTVCAK